MAPPSPEGAACPTHRVSPTLSEEAWAAQLEEVMALQAIYPDDVRLLSAPGPLQCQLQLRQRQPCGSGSSSDGAGSCSSCDGHRAHHHDSSCSSRSAAVGSLAQTAEALLAAGYPASALEGAGGDGSPPLEPVAVEAVVHVEVPQGGLQLALGVGQRRQEEAASSGHGVQELQQQQQEQQPVALPMSIAPRLQHLTPMRLTMTLPSDYPASQPPAFEIHAMWLSAAQAQQLHAALQGLWAEQGPGGPIGFAWIDWLRSASLEHLGVKDTLVLRDGCADAELDEQVVEGGKAEEGGGAGRAALFSPSREVVAMALLRYNEAREQQQFEESFVTCAICFGQFLGRQCVRLPECRHAYCRTCISTHVRTQLGDGAVDNMRCPEPSCRRALPPDTLHQLLTQAEFERLEVLLLQRALDKMEDLTYCPRCHGACLEDKDHCTLCPHCYFAFCAQCQEPWHPGSACNDGATELAALEARMQQRQGQQQQHKGKQQAQGAGASNAGTSKQGQGGGHSPDTDAQQQPQQQQAVEDEDQARIQRDLNRIYELRGLMLVKRTAKRCPSCGIAINKEGGCNKMTCRYCGVYWCWRCGEQIKGYDHFHSGACPLTQGAAREAEAPVAGHDAAMRHEADELWQLTREMRPELEQARKQHEAEQRKRAQDARQRELAARHEAWLERQKVRQARCGVCGQENRKRDQQNLLRCWACASHYCYLCRTVLRGPEVRKHFGPDRCKQHSPD